MRISSRKPKSVLFVAVAGIILFICVAYFFVLSDDRVTTNHRYKHFTKEKSFAYRHNDFKEESTTRQIQGAGKVGKEKAIEHELLLETHEGQAAASVDTVHEGQAAANVGAAHEEYVIDKLNTVTEDWLNASVVEEHHEVIPYWFQAANRGTIPKEGNLLIHIDGHSDTAPLLYVPGYPFFKWPTKEQLSFLMQRNDGFIQASAMTGLLDRLIWVWPTWDERNSLNPHEEPYVKYEMHLGWMDVTNETQAHTNVAFCMCMEDQNYCFTTTEIQSEAENDSTHGFFPAHRSRCHILKTLTVEEVSEQVVITYFKKFEWNSKNQSIILDIDEDFYGCSYAVNPIIQAKVDLEHVEIIDKGMQELFCPMNSEQDAESNIFFKNLLSEVLKSNNCKNGILKRSVKCRKYIKDNISIFTQRLSSLIKQKLINLCQPNYDLGMIIQSFLKQITKFSSEQILSLVEVGFCANTSPKTHDMLYERKFGICMGANSPNRSAIMEHIPTQKEVDSRSIILKGILRRIKYPVHLVTIARSVRDGYTPRKYFEQIEKDIIGNLRATLDRNMHVFYDEDLLGGRKGWGTRKGD